MIDESWLVPGLAAAMLLVALVLTAMLLTERRRTRGELDAARREAAELRERVERLIAAREPAAGPQPEFVITSVRPEAGAELAPRADRQTGGESAPQPAVGRIEGRLFADIVLRETLVKAATVAGGVRRVLDPATRNRVRFEMRREVKRSRKRRRAEQRAARRHLADRQRAAVVLTEDPADPDEDAA